MLSAADVTSWQATTMDILPDGLAHVQGQVSSGEWDVYKFTPSARGKIVLGLAGSGGLDSYLELYKGSTRISRNDNASRRTLDSRVVFKVMPGVDYYIRAGGAHATGGDYSMSVSSVAFDDHGDSLSAARALTISRKGKAAASGKINYSSDEDWFTFTSRVDGHLKIDLKEYRQLQHSNTQLSVYDSSGNLVQTVSDPAVGGVTISAAAGQRYSIAVVPMNSAAYARYTVRILNDLVPPAPPPDGGGGGPVDDMSIVPGTLRVFYASSAGGGSGLSRDSAFTVADFWQVARAGDTLLLLDGTYTGANSMIMPPAGLSGVKGQPISVAALNDGGADIDGQGVNMTVVLQSNNWFVLQGFNAHDSSMSVYSLNNSSNNTLKRLAGWDAADSNTSIFFALLGSSSNLFEDCAGWGIARKIFQCWSGADDNTFRRCWGRWEGSHVWGPKMTFSMAYNTTGTILEDCIGTWNALKMKEQYELQDYFGGGTGIYQNNYSVQGAFGIFANDGSDRADLNINVTMRGCLAYVLPGDRCDGFVYDFGAIDVQWVNGVTLEGNTSIVTGSILPYNLRKLSGGQDSNNDFARNNVEVALRSGAMDSCWQVDNHKHVEPGQGITLPASMGNWAMSGRIFDAMVLGQYSQPVNVNATLASLRVA